MENLLTKHKKIFDQEGIPAFGIVDYDLALPLYQEHAKKYSEWIANGSQGEMEYLRRGLDRRLNPRLVFPNLQSVLTVIMPYDVTPVGDEKLRYSRYLNGSDYHSVLKEKLEKIMKELSSKMPNLEYKVCVDTSAVLERTWAALSGLGWIGKNTLLIHPQLGSYVFIGVVFLNQKLHAPPVLLKDYCGSCTRCLNACPTDALKIPHYLESKDCISYLTLEKRGTWDKNYSVKGFVAGCDICQEVCPFNTKAVRANTSQQVSEYLILDSEKLVQETEEEYKARVAGTALSRIKFADFKRNLKALV